MRREKKAKGLENEDKILYESFGSPFLWISTLLVLQRLLTSRKNDYSFVCETIVWDKINIKNEDLCKTWVFDILRLCLDRRRLDGKERKQTGNNNILRIRKFSTGI